jgi:hypothetical protein
MPLVRVEEVTGSIPVKPTRSAAMSIFVEITVGAIPVAKWSAARYAPGHDRQAWLGEDCIYFDHSGSAATLRPIGIARAAGVAWSALNLALTASGGARRSPVQPRSGPSSRNCTTS